MSITVVCKCGQRLKAKEKLAGTKVKCPKCEAVLAVPRLGDAPAAGSTASTAPSATSQSKPAKPCPSCGNDMPASNVVCPHCSYPREIEFVADLPKTVSGKIRRVELRERG